MPLDEARDGESERRAGSRPGWEKEHGVDHADFLDALLDDDDPLHEVASRAADNLSAPASPPRYLPADDLIPPCPRCGDHAGVQKVVFGVPALPPDPSEVERVKYAGCVVDTSQPLHDWYCPRCDLGYGWGYPVSRTLLVKEPWVSLILDGTKTWEMRRSATSVRGLIGLTPSGSGEVVGTAVLSAVHGPFAVAELDDHIEQHRVDREFLADYAAGGPLFAWELTGARRLSSPLPYEHPQGAVIWVKLPPWPPGSVAR